MKDLDSTGFGGPSQKVIIVGGGPGGSKPPVLKAEQTPAKARTAAADQKLGERLDQRPQRDGIGAQFAADLAGLDRPGGAVPVVDRHRAEGRAAGRPHRCQAGSCAFYPGASDSGARDDEERDDGHPDPE